MLLKPFETSCLFFF